MGGGITMSIQSLNKGRNQGLIRSKVQAFGANRSGRGLYRLEVDCSITLILSIDADEGVWYYSVDDYIFVLSNVTLISATVRKFSMAGSLLWTVYINPGVAVTRDTVSSVVASPDGGCMICISPWGDTYARYIELDESGSIVFSVLNVNFARFGSFGLAAGSAQFLGRDLVYAFTANRSSPEGIRWGTGEQYIWSPIANDGYWFNRSHSVVGGFGGLTIPGYQTPGIGVVTTSPGHPSIPYRNTRSAVQPLLTGFSVTQRRFLAWTFYDSALYVASEVQWRIGETSTMTNPGLFLFGGWETTLPEEGPYSLLSDDHGLILRSLSATYRYSFAGVRISDAAERYPLKAGFDGETYLVR